MNDPILAGYSDEMLSLAKRDLSKSVQSGRAGTWEQKRLVAIKAEIERRKLKRR